MNDSAPPPPGALPHAPPNWQDPGLVPMPTVQRAPAFDPRRAIGAPGSHAARPNHSAGHGLSPVMAPPPMRQDNSPAGVPSPYAAPPSYDVPPYDAPPAYPAPAPHLGYDPQAAPPYPGRSVGPDGYGTRVTPDYGHAPGQYDQNYGDQPAYAYPTEATVEPAGGRESLMSKLTGRIRSNKPADSYQAPEHNHGQNHDLGQEAVPKNTSARKPFLMGLLTGVVVMLILGQVFRAAGPADDFAQALPQTEMTITDGPAADDPEMVAFLDTVEGLN